MKKLLLFLFLLTAAIAARAAVNGSVNFTDQDLIISVDDSAEEPIAVYPNAVQTVYGEDNVTFAAGSKVKLIEKGKVIFDNFDNTTKSSAKALSSEQNIPSTIIEGRTFWYTQKWFWQPVYEEYGITIGPDTIIEDVIWKKMQVRKVGRIEDNEIQYITEDNLQINHYQIREDGNSIYFRYEPFAWLACTEEYDAGFFNLRLNDPKFKEFLTYYSTSDYDCPQYVAEFKVFEFGKECDIFKQGNDEFYAEWFIGSVEPIEINGRTYEKYEAGLIDRVQGHFMLSNLKCTYQFIKGLGFIPDYCDDAWYRSHLFYAPLGNHYYMTPHYSPPVLRYITDADDSILYEGKGGMRLWELDPMGIDSVTIDSSQAVGYEEWYTIHGVRVPVPSSPGIYIRTSASGTEKVVIR